jgi:hypothetical protein
MLSLGVSVDVEKAYYRQLAGTYTLKTVLQIMDLQHNVISTVSHLLQDGGVTAELVTTDDDKATEVGVQQTYSCHLLDPGRSLGFDSRSPADASIFLDRMLKVIESVYVVQPEYTGWVDCPVFCGPITKFDRDNDVVSVEAQSKEAIAESPAHRNATYKGNKVAAITQMLVDTGEDLQHIDLPIDTSTTAKDIVFVWETHPWAQAWLLAKSLTKTLFYDGRGVARMTDNSSSSVFTFDGTMISGLPQQSTDGSNVRNAVKVIGSKSSISYTAELPDTHPLSPVSLGRNGKKRYLMDDPTENSDLTKQADVTALAVKMLDDVSRTVVETTFEAFPVWNLEIGDLVFLNLPDFVGEVRVKSFTKPSTVTDNMSVGYTYNAVTPGAAAIRRP